MLKHYDYKSKEIRWKCFSIITTFAGTESTVWKMVDIKRLSHSSCLIWTDSFATCNSFLDISTTLGFETFENASFSFSIHWNVVYALHTLISNFLSWLQNNYMVFKCKHVYHHNVPWKTETIDHNVPWITENIGSDWKLEIEFTLITMAS